MGTMRQMKKEWVSYWVGRFGVGRGTRLERLTSFSTKVAVGQILSLQAKMASAPSSKSLNFEAESPVAIYRYRYM